MRRLLISAWLNSFSVSVPVLPNCNWKLPELAYFDNLAFAEVAAHHVDQFVED